MVSLQFMQIFFFFAVMKCTFLPSKSGCYFWRGSKLFQDQSWKMKSVSTTWAPQTAAWPWGHTTESHPKWNADKRFIANAPPPLCTWPLTALECWTDLTDAKNMPQKVCNLPPALLPFPSEEMQDQHHVERVDSIAWCHPRLSPWIVTLCICGVTYSSDIFCR